jgi:hypothetical protein
MKTIKKYRSFEELKSSEKKALDKASIDKKHKEIENFIKSISKPRVNKK